MITFNEYSVDTYHAILETVHTAAESSEWQMFARPLSAFGVRASHTTTGTFSCTLEGTLDGVNAITIQDLVNTANTAFVTGKTVLGIRHTIGSMASSGTVLFTTVSKDAA